MWRAWILSAFAAAVASLAAAEPAEATERKQPPATTPAKADVPDRWSVLGFDICFGDSGNSNDLRTCDVTLPIPATPKPHAPETKRITFLGTTLCIGGTPEQPGCDVRLPSVDLHG